MKIKFIAMGVLAAALSTTVVFADDMQSNNPAGAQGQPAASQPNTMNQAMQNQPGSTNAAAPTDANMSADKKTDATNPAPQQTGSY